MHSELKHFMKTAPSRLLLAALIGLGCPLDFTAARAEVDFAKPLRPWDGFGFNYVSLHNEGEGWMRWNQGGFTERWSHDYNLFWPPEQGTDYVKLLRDLLDVEGMNRTSTHRSGQFG